MLKVGYKHFQNYEEGNQSQAAIAKTSTLFAYRIKISSMSALHDPSEQLNGHGRLWMP
jgi:hypothetical protein